MDPIAAFGVSGALSCLVVVACIDWWRGRRARNSLTTKARERIASTTILADDIQKHAEEMDRLFATSTRLAVSIPDELTFPAAGQPMAEEHVKAILEKWASAPKLRRVRLTLFVDLDDARESERRRLSRELEDLGYYAIVSSKGML